LDNVSTKSSSVDGEQEASKTTSTKVWESQGGAREGTFSVTMKPNQRLELCLGNQWNEDADNEDAAGAGGDEAANQAKSNNIENIRVGLNFRVHAIPRSLPAGVDGPDTEKATRITSKAVGIETDWSNLMDHFAFLRSREAVHLRLTQEILDRILGWTIIEAVVVVCMATGQVLYWRKFFEQRRYL